MTMRDLLWWVAVFSTITAISAATTMQVVARLAV